jgi:hypothetical protein
MSEQAGVKENFLSGATWLRALYMVLFVLIYGIAEILVAAVAVLQLVFVLVTGKRNDQLLAFGGSLSTFVYQIMLFWTFRSEDKPFPFSDWPSSE